MSEACAVLPKRSSRGTQILTRRSQSALGLGTAAWAAKMVIFIYSNILLSVSMINMTHVRVSLRPERPLELFEVLARNRQSAVGLLARIRTRTRTTTPNVYNTSSTTTVLSQPVGHTNMENCPNHPHHQLNTQIHFKAHIFVRNIYTYILLNTPAIRSAAFAFSIFLNELETNERFDVYHRG